MGLERMRQIGHASQSYNFLASFDILCFESMSEPLVYRPIDSSVIFAKKSQGMGGG